MGRIKDLRPFTNLKNALMNEGFVDLNASYLGELWVLLEFSSVKSKKAFRDNVGVSSWFSLCGRQASFDINPDGRIVWVEIKGVPLKLWTLNTFKRIVTRGGELIDPNTLMGIVSTRNDYGEVVIMGDFNEVRVKSDRFGTNFNVLGANIFNSFINSTGLEEVHLGGTASLWTDSYPITDRFFFESRPMIMVRFPFDSFTIGFIRRAFNDFVTSTWNSAPSVDSKGNANLEIDSLNHSERRANNEMRYPKTISEVSKSGTFEREVKWRNWDSKLPNLLLREWSDGNISTLIHVLKCFFHASGLKINLNKSKIMGINVESAQVIQAAAKLGCLVLKCPFYYLGTRVGGSMTRVQAWQEIVEKVKSRLSKWKSKTLSIGGHLTLLKSVLGSIPVFHMSIFKVPSKVLHILESIRSHFFNGHDPGSKKASWVKWNNVLTDKKRGGLGVSSLFALNRLMIKLGLEVLLSPPQKDSSFVTKVIIWLTITSFSQENRNQ
ncbi:RNA-directed DNA polymerase, eukaryota, reverse transcriptase zinc-binding domain protein [Tanacetum coccineum]